MALRYHITSDLHDAKVYYFLTLLTDKYQLLNKRWARELEKRYGKPFKPIYILSNEHKTSMREQDYIVVNDQLETAQTQFPDRSIVNLIYSEDLNELASNDEQVRGLIETLLDEQHEVFVLSFTSSRLDFGNPRVRVLGPKNDLVDEFDNKASQIRLFKKLHLQRHSAEIYPSVEVALSAELNYPCYVTAAYSSGGIEGGVMQTKRDFETLAARLRPLNKQAECVVAEYIDDIKEETNSVGFAVAPGDIRIICISDQIMRGNRYMGNSYPSLASEASKEEIRRVTKKVGDELAQSGFRGLFGIDFMIRSDGEILPVDLNPRRQGGYLCNVLMSSKIDLVEQECRLALGEKVQAFSELDTQSGIAWAHSKLSPYQRLQTLRVEFQKGKPEEVFQKPGMECYETYYPSGALLVEGNPGQYIVTGTDPKELRAMVGRRVDELINKLYQT